MASAQHCDALAKQRYRGIRVESDQFQLARVSSTVINHQELIRDEMKPRKLTQVATTDPTPKCIVFFEWNLPPGYPRCDVLAVIDLKISLFEVLPVSYTHLTLPTKRIV